MTDYATLKVFHTLGLILATVGTGIFAITVYNLKNSLPLKTIVRLCAGYGLTVFGILLTIFIILISVVVSKA